MKRRDRSGRDPDVHDDAKEVDVRALDGLRLEEVVSYELNATRLDRFGILLRPDLLENDYQPTSRDRKERRGRTT